MDREIPETDSSLSIEVPWCIHEVLLVAATMKKNMYPFENIASEACAAPAPWWMSCDLATRSLLSSAKNFSGEFRRDFRTITQADKSYDEKLSILLKYTQYDLSEVQRYAALAVLNSLNSRTYNVFSIALNFERDPVLVEFATAITHAFEIKDKYSRRWGTLYALVSKKKSGQVIAELGVTERTFIDVVEQLRTSRSSQYSTKLGRFLGEVDVSGFECYLWPLESFSGDLDDMDVVKERWKLAGLYQLVEFPQRPYTAHFSESLEQTWREWPLFEVVVEHGVRIR